MPATYQGPFYLTDGKSEVRFACLGERASVIDAKGERETTCSEARQVWLSLVRLGFRRFVPKSAPMRRCSMSDHWTGD